MLFNVNESAKALGGISPWTLRKHISRGTIRVVRIGTRVLIDGEELDRIRKAGLPSLRVGSAQQASSNLNEEATVDS